MDTQAYDAMQAIQERHWWWRGMRQLYGSALERFLPSPAPGGKHRLIIDVGCGFGANLPVLSPLGDVVGADLSLEALQAINPRPSLGLVQARADALPFRADAFDVVALLAVVEHVDRDDIVLSEARRVSRKNGLQILLTSAFMLLWSHHDEANLHRRRYLASQMDKLQRQAGWRPLVNSYVNAAIFPAVAAVRIWQRRSEHGQAEPVSEYDMGPDLGPFNRWLEQFLIIEAWLVIHGISLPFGVDVFTVAHRDDSTS